MARTLADITPENSTIRDMMEVYRATANDLDAEQANSIRHQESADYYSNRWKEMEAQRDKKADEAAKIQKQLDEEKLKHANTREQLQKVRHHRDDLAAKIKAARAKLTEEPQISSEEILAILADTKNQENPNA